MAEYENLFPEDDEEEIIAEELEDEEETPVGYLDSVYFDDEIGDFVRDGQHRLKTATGIEAWEQWCINCLLTEKEKYPAYGDLFGIATEEAFQSDDRAEIESILTLEITEGLMNDPYGRTEFVESVDFNWLESHTVEITVTVRGIDDVTRDITAVIDQRAR